MTSAAETLERKVIRVAGAWDRHNVVALGEEPRDRQFGGVDDF